MTYQLPPHKALELGKLQAEYQRLLNQLARCHEMGDTSLAVEQEDKLAGVRARIRRARIPS